MAVKEPQLEYASKADERSAREDFENLKNHPAWQRIVAFMDEKIEFYEKILTGDIKADDGASMIKTIDELERYRDKRNLAMQFRNLPEIITTQEELNNTEPNLDPYE